MTQLPPLDKNQILPLPASFPQIPQIPQENPVTVFLKKLLQRKKVIGVVLLVPIVILIGILAFKLQPYSKQTLPPKEPVTTEKTDQILAVVDGQKIYKSDLEKIALKENRKGDITSKVLNALLEREIERKILESEARKLSIEVSEEDIARHVISKQATASAKTQTFEDYIFYQILREKIMAKSIKSVSAFVIGYWVPPIEYPQEPIYTVQRSDGKKAMTEAAQKLKNNETPLSVVEYLYNKYDSLKPILGLNGYNFGQIKNASVFLQPKLFVLDRAKLEKLNDPEFYEALATMKISEIKIVERKDQSGGAVIQLVAINNEGYTSYSEFLEAKKKELVK